MFGLFKKDPAQKLKADYARLLEKARDIQRNGDVVAAAKTTAEAEQVLRKIEELESADA